MAATSKNASKTRTTTLGGRLTCPPGPLRTAASNYPKLAPVASLKPSIIVSHVSAR